MNELANVENTLLFEPENITKETIKKYLCPMASDQELMMGLQIAKTYKLNPLKREVYFVKYKADQPMQVLTGYEVYLKRAERSGKYNGLEITSEGSIKDGSLKAKVKVFRKDWDNPLVHEAYYSEYVQMKKDFKTGEESPNKFWASKPVTMIKKVAVSQAFRMAFPDEFDGMPYTTDEVVDQEKVIDVEIEKPLQMPTAKAEEVKKEEVKIENTVTSSNDMKIDNATGKDLLGRVVKAGKTKQDLLEFIFFTFNLEKLNQITYGHMNLINQWLEKKDASVR